MTDRDSTKDINMDGAYSKRNHKTQSFVIKLSSEDLNNCIAPDDKTEQKF